MNSLVIAGAGILILIVLLLTLWKEGKLQPLKSQPLEERHPCIDDEEWWREL